MSTYERDATTGELKQIDGMRSVDDIKALMLDLCYPIGSIYISTKNVSPQSFLGGTWKSKSNYVLRGATSNVTFNSDTNDGGADSVTVSSVANHNHTQNSHKHQQNIEIAGYSGWSVSQTSYMQYAGFANPANRNRSTAATNIYTGDKTATNIANGANYTVNTLPKYKNVYIWERTA